jgi:hypothetical protein
MISLCGMAFSAMFSFMSAQGCLMQGGGCVLQQGQWVPVSAPPTAQIESSLQAFPALPK